MSGILKIAHRGASGYAPENTLSAFKKAIDLGSDMIELDVYKTEDNQLVVIHDRLIDRLTSGSGFVNNFSLSHLKDLDIKGSGKIPTLEEAVDLVLNKIKINIEIKEIGITKDVIDLVNRKKIENQVLISSFYHYEVRKSKEINSNIKTAILFWGVPVTPEDLVDLIKKAKADGANLEYEFVTKEYVDVLHKNNFFIYVYTVNDIREITLMKNLGVDGIISNYPDRI